MSFDFQAGSKKATKAVNIRVPVALLKAYEAEAETRSATISDLILQAMRYTLTQVEKGRKKKTKSIQP